jgi:hypothetical protein
VTNLEAIGAPWVRERTFEENVDKHFPTLLAFKLARLATAASV